MSESNQFNNDEHVNVHVFDHSMNHDTVQKPVKLNIVEFEFLVLAALQLELGDAVVDRNGLSTRFGFLVEGNKRAVVEIEIVDRVLCENCDEEILFPGYKQSAHSVCPRKDS